MRTRGLPVCTDSNSRNSLFIRVSEIIFGKWSKEFACVLGGELPRHQSGEKVKLWHGEPPHAVIDCFAAMRRAGASPFEEASVYGGQYREACGGGLDAGTERNHPVAREKATICAR